MPYLWLIVCSCFNHSIRNVLVLVGKCTMCSKFKGLFLKSRPCQFWWFIRKLTNVTFSYKPILIIRSLGYSFGSCCLYFLNLKLLEDWRLMIFSWVTETCIFSYFFPWGNFFSLKLLRHLYIWMHFTQSLSSHITKRRETRMQCLFLSDMWMFHGKTFGNRQRW